MHVAVRAKFSKQHVMFDTWSTFGKQFLVLYACNFSCNRKYPKSMDAT